jgi:hypothetical protein
MRPSVERSERIASGDTFSLSCREVFTMVDVSSDEVGARVADELARVWPSVWTDLALDFQSDTALRDYALRRAREILTVVIEGYAMFGEDPQFGPASLALQSLGEGYALMSEPWPIDARIAPALPVRSNVVGLLRQFGVDAWLEDYGRPIDLDGDGAVADGPMSVFDPQEVDDRMLAEYFVQEIVAYRWMLGTMGSDQRRIEVARRGANFRRSMCVRISGYRRFFDALGLRSDQGGITRRAVAIALVMVDWEFLAASVDPTQPRDSVPMLPDGLLDGLVKEVGVEEWLHEYGLEIPSPE